MQNRTNPLQRHSRGPVSWPVLYGNGAFLAEGTVLNLTSLGWRVAGTIPVAPGMELTLQVSIPERPTPLSVYRATVLCVNDHDFAIEAHEMTPNDRAWVTEFLRHKCELTATSQTTDQGTSLQTSDETPHKKTSLPQPSVPLVEDILHRFCSLDPAATDWPSDAQLNSDADGHESQAHTRGNHVSETLVHETRRIVRCMVALHAARVRTGQNPIPDN